jgi:hypothetical protein
MDCERHAEGARPDALGRCFPQPSERARKLARRCRFGRRPGASCDHRQTSAFAGRCESVRVVARQHSCSGRENGGFSPLDPGFGSADRDQVGQRPTAGPRTRPRQTLQFTPNGEETPYSARRTHTVPVSHPRRPAGGWRFHPAARHLAAGVVGADDQQRARVRPHRRDLRAHHLAARPQRARVRRRDRRRCDRQPPSARPAISCASSWSPSVARDGRSWSASRSGWATT